MTRYLCPFLCLASMLWSSSLFAAGSIFIEPFPTYNQANPLMAESPIAFGTKDGRALRVEIRCDGVLVFPRHSGEGIVDAGVSIQLDPGPYDIRISEVGASGGKKKRAIVTWVYVLNSPQTIDLRADGPAVNSQLLEVLALLKAAKSHHRSESAKTDGMVESLSEVSTRLGAVESQLSDIKQDLEELHEQFIVEDGSRRIVEMPLQHMFDQIQALESRQEDSKSKH